MFFLFMSSNRFNVNFAVATVFKMIVAIVVVKAVDGNKLTPFLKLQNPFDLKEKYSVYSSVKPLIFATKNDTIVFANLHLSDRCKSDYGE